MRISKTGAAAIYLSISMALIGCGSSTPAPVAFTQTQALTATADIFEALANASVAGGFARRGVVSAEVTGVRNPSPNAEAIQYTTIPSGIKPFVTPTTIPPYTFACPAGGNIVVNGSYSGTTTSQTVTIVETINSCGDSGFVINGDPNVSLTGTSTESGNLFTEVITMSGGFTSGSTVCMVNVTISATVNDVTYAESGSIVGSVCGVSVNSTI